ncbi:hypothetical protein [Fictibacillus sp. 18YEL24]|uniref:hypothetical protein n=1 Tax=Fictibacillus sp. 18YEL24 TaxID=2745875 RepID=UPI0018CFB99F|nr:hypothetical protein [Fictibacillus sp. 18YEL24]MBH0168155.1 hypothetical protein [Fictibacillus sp. 18YEL24]
MHFQIEEVKKPPKDAPKENNSNQAESKDGEVTKQIIDKFNLDEDFTAFDLEVQFEDGSEKEYKINP